MFRTASIIAVIGAALSASAQQQGMASAEDTLSYHEVLPKFPGGDSVMYAYLRTHTQYPKEAIENNITGKVWVQFIVEKDGSVDSVRTVHSVHPLLDEEAERVVRSMPPWAPGTQMGRPVRTRFNVPIIFELISHREAKKRKKARGQ